MQCTKEVISILPFWPSLSEQQKQQFESGLLYKRCRARESLTFSGEKKDGMLIVLHGVIRVYMVSGTGREVTILIMRHGDVFNILTADCARPGDIMPQLQAMSDAAVAYIRRAELSRLAYGCPAAAEYIIETSSRNAQDILNNINEYFFCPLRSKIAGFLLKISMQQNGDCALITHEDIANHLGTTREVVSREIKYLRHTGLIKSGRGRITLLDRSGLRALAGRSGEE